MRLNFMKKLLLLAIIPCMIVGIAVALLSCKTLTTNISNEVEETLHSVSLSLSETANFIDLESNQDLLNQYKSALHIDTTLFIDNVREVTTVDGSVGTTADPTIYAHVKSGQNYFSSNANVNGVEYFGYYIPVYNESNDFIGMSFAGKPTKEMNAVVLKVVGIIFLVMAIILCVMVAVIVIIARTMVKQMNNSSKLIDELANGNLNVDTNEVYSDDEIGNIYRQAVLLTQKLKTSVGDIMNVSHELHNMSVDLNKSAEASSSGTDGIAYAIEEIATGAGSQAEETQDGAHNMSNVNDNIFTIQEQTAELENISKQMQEIEEEVMKEINSSIELNTKTNNELSIVNEKVDKTSVSIENIKKATDIIRDIADQTQLLSLNASIEAAHAGEHGKGFAVVATNVGTLAKESKKASEDIENILTEVFHNYEDMKRSMSDLVLNIEQQSINIESTSKQFTVLDENIEKVVSFINDISQSTQDVKKLSDSMLGIMSNLSAISEENAASTEETMASIEELNATINEVSNDAKKLNEISNRLIDTVKFFKV